MENENINTQAGNTEPEKPVLDGVIMKSRIIFKHDTEVNWNQATNFIPKKGELILYDPDNTYDYTRMKIGDGSTKVSSLPFLFDKLHDLEVNLGEYLAFLVKA